MALATSGFGLVSAASKVAAPSAIVGGVVRGVAGGAVGGVVGLATCDKEFGKQVLFNTCDLSYPNDFFLNAGWRSDRRSYWWSSWRNDW